MVFGHLDFALCRYEDEEAVDVCEAMERMAQLFLSDSGKVEEVTDEVTDEQGNENKQELDTGTTPEQT